MGVQVRKSPQLSHRLIKYHKSISICRTKSRYDHVAREELTKVCSVISTKSSASLKCSSLNESLISKTACLANGVISPLKTKIAFDTFSSFILSVRILIGFTPTFSSSGKKTKSWLVSSSAFSLMGCQFSRLLWCRFDIMSL